jgi:hypothetical protein
VLGRIMATAGLGGTLALGGAGLASASPTPAHGPRFSCAHAPQALARINQFESRATTYLSKAPAREAAAVKAGKPTRAAAIAARSAAVRARQVRARALVQRIETACPGAAAAPSSGSGPAT